LRQRRVTYGVTAFLVTSGNRARDTLRSRTRRSKPSDVSSFHLLDSAFNADYLLLVRRRG